MSRGRAPQGGLLNNWDAFEPEQIATLVRAAVTASALSANRPHAIREPTSLLISTVDHMGPFLFPATSGGEALVAAARRLSALGHLSPSTEPDPPRCVLSDEGRSEIRRERHAGETCQCPITLANIGPGDDTAVLPCGHRFSPAALHTWLAEYAAQCPVCRAQLPSREVRPLPEVFGTTARAPPTSSGSV